MIDKEIFHMQLSNEQADNCNKQFLYYSDKVKSSPYDAEAVNGLGECYYFGYGTAKNTDEGLKLIETAAKLGSAKANFNLANIFARETNYEKAVSLYETAADLGYTDSYFELGNLYRNLDSERDSDKALHYYKLAADHNNPNAQLVFAKLYSKGEIVPQNSEFAHKYFEKSAKGGNEEAQFQTGFDYENGVGTEPDLSKAVYWYEQASSKKHKEASYRLAVLNLRSEDKNAKENAVKLLEAAADNGNSDAMYKLGELYKYGSQYVPKDLAKSKYYFDKGSNLDNGNCTYELALIDNDIELMKKAEHQGDINASVYLGKIEEGAQHYENAYRYYSKAYEKNSPDAAYRIGKMFELGRGLNFDIIKALELYSFAASNGNVDSMREIGICYAKGKGISADINQAIAWLSKAADNADAEAALFLSQLLMETGSEANINEAEIILTKIKENNISEIKYKAAYYLALLYTNSERYADAFWLWSELAENGNRNAQFNLAMFYCFGLGANVNYEKAKEWWRKSAENGHKAAHKYYNMLTKNKLEELLFKKEST